MPGTAIAGSGGFSTKEHIFGGSIVGMRVLFFFVFFHCLIF